MQKKIYRKSKSIKTIAWILGALASLFIGYQVYTYFRGNFFTPSGETVYIYIHEHATFDDVVKQIEKKTKPRSMASFIALAKSEGYPNKIRTGRYAIKNGMTNHKLLNNLRKHVQAPVKLTFNNIRTKAQLAGRLSKQLMADSLTLLSLLNDSVTDVKLGFNPETVVAMFIPNTYDVLWDITPVQLLKRMHHEYESFWTDERKQKAKTAHFSPVEVATLASIIEEETNHKADKPIVAGLYMNRLRLGMPLQSCPTIKFALNDFALQRITGVHLRVNSPYNTYKNPGLPPGPIRIPSIESIDAVLNFKPNNYLYMCAKETLNGEHYFAATWAEHKRNADRYAAMMNKRGIH
jgi:UPF0755 protein